MKKNCYIFRWLLLTVFLYISIDTRAESVKSGVSFVDKYVNVTIGESFTANPWGDAGFDFTYKCFSTYIQENSGIGSLDITETKVVVTNVPHYNGQYKTGYYCTYNITTIKAGEYKIVFGVSAFKKTTTLYDERCYVTYHVTVSEKPKVVSISIPNNLILKVGDSYTFSPIIYETGASTTLTWSSSNTSVVSINNGKITAVSPGNSTITCTATNGVSAKCEVVVTPIYINSISLNQSELDVEVGEKVTLIASILPVDATNKEIEWSSSNNNIAFVGSTGIVVGISEGYCNITASAKDGSNRSASCLVHVKKAIVKVESIILEPNFAALKVGETMILKATIFPQNVTDGSISWSSSDTSVATVDSNGKVTAVSIGEAVISATANDGSLISASCTLTISNNEEEMAEKKAEAIEVLNAAMKVYEQFMSYYDGNGRAYYQKVVSAQESNNTKVLDIFDGIDALEKKIDESGLMVEEKAAYQKALADIKASVETENKNLLVDNKFAETVKKYYESVSAYQEKLAEYKKGIEEATTIEKLDEFIASINKDAENAKASYLELVEKEYAGLKTVEEELQVVSKNLDDLKAQFDKCSAEVDIAISKDIFVKKQQETMNVFEAAMTVYEQFMFYYKDGMEFWKAIKDEWTRNFTKIDEIETDIKTLLNTIVESTMADADKTAYVKALNDLAESVSVLYERNKNVSTSEAYYFGFTAENALGCINAYESRLVKYKERIEVAATADELDTLIAEINQDAESVKTSCLNPVASKYEGLEPLTQEVSRISKELNKLGMTVLSYADAVNNAITGISDIGAADSEVLTIYTISGRQQVMKKSELPLLPKGLYIINGKKYVAK